MILLDRIVALRNRHRLPQLVHQTAVRSRDIVWQRVMGRVDSMSLHEACGYTRARARRVVEDFIQQLIRREPALGDHQPQLVEQTLEMVTRMILSAIIRSRQLPVRRQQAA